jgi:antibiotic biosynthesis monooxygenase (ABM) superfamily enzyme
MTDPDRTAVLVTTRLVRRGRAEEFERWAERHDAAIRASPGVLGTVRLDQPGGFAHFVQRFASEEEARRWSEGPERASLTAEASAFSAEHRQCATGMSVSLRLPSEAAVPNWKNWLATWACAYPVSLVLNYLLEALPITLPKFVQVGIISGALIAVLTWFVLPRVRGVLRPWLLACDEGLRKEPG